MVELVNDCWAWCWSGMALAWFIGWLMAGTLMALFPAKRPHKLTKPPDRLASEQGQVPDNDDVENDA